MMFSFLKKKKQRNPVMQKLIETLSIKLTEEEEDAMLEVLRAKRNFNESPNSEYMIYQLKAAEIRSKKLLGRTHAIFVTWLSGKNI